MRSTLLVAVLGATVVSAHPATPSTNAVASGPEQPDITNMLSRFVGPLAKGVAWLDSTTADLSKGDIMGTLSHVFAPVADTFSWLGLTAADLTKDVTIVEAIAHKDWKAIETAVELLWNAAKDDFDDEWLALKALLHEMVGPVLDVGKDLAIGEAALHRDWNAVEAEVERLWNATKHEVEQRWNDVKGDFSVVVARNATVAGTKTRQQRKLGHRNDRRHAQLLVPTSASLLDGKADQAKSEATSDPANEEHMHHVMDVVAAAPLPAFQDNQVTTNGQPRLGDDIQKREAGHHHQEAVTELHKAPPVLHSNVRLETAAPVRAG